MITVVCLVVRPCASGGVTVCDILVVHVMLQFAIHTILQVAVNEYADLTWEEFRSVKLGLQPGLDGSFRFAHGSCWHCSSRVHQKCGLAGGVRLYNSRGFAQLLTHKELALQPSTGERAL